ncbi:DUF2804 domain-containing protein [Ornithinimicrobium panacihumi]|uniref:DUF2804 domain-containing protein n=1 Tax=Ornithinimicrobium panacihumi TaxID=2008449 RepID=UPI003F898779
MLTVCGVSARRARPDRGAHRDRVSGGVGVVVSGLDYAALHSIYVLDRETGQETNREVVVPLGRRALLPERSGGGPASGRGKGLSVDIREDVGTTTLQARSKGVELDLTIPGAGERDALAVVVPWSERRFQLTLKDVGRPVAGTLLLEGKPHTFAEGDSFAVLDHGRGKWPYAVRWNWAAGSRPDGDLAVQLGGRWTDGTGQTENGLIVDGRLHKIHGDLTWTYDRDDWMRPWRIHGARVDVELVPFHERVAKTQLGVVASETHQCFGTFRGWVLDDVGERIVVDSLTGWAEEARQRW